MRIERYYKEILGTTDKSVFPGNEPICTIYLCDNDKEEADLQLLKETFNEECFYTDYANMFNAKAYYNHKEEQS